MNHKSIALIGIGIIIILVSIVQWVFLFPDPSQLMLGTLLGTAFIGLGNYKDALEYLFQKISSLEHRLDSLVFDMDKRRKK